MEKITIIGSYTRQSIGDRLILLSLLDLLFRVGSEQLRVEAVTFDSESFEREVAAFTWRERVEIRAISVTAADPNVQSRSAQLGQLKQMVVKTVPPVIVSWIRVLLFVSKIS